MIEPRPTTAHRRRVVAGAALAPGILTLAVTGALAAASKTNTIADEKDDVSGVLDIQRASLGLGSDGRLRAVATFTAKVTPKAMLADSGPPGSVCLRIWTEPKADPAAMRPDRLVCATARSADELRAGVYEQKSAKLPERIGDASVRLNASGRSVIIRFAQSTLGRPARIRYAFESTRPGCERASCIDTAPDGGVARAFRLR